MLFDGYHTLNDYYAMVRIINQPDIRNRIRCRKSQKKRRLEKRRRGKRK